ncbi:pheromone-regulated protein prm10 [Coemansia guatemalensis]|uniref:Pheromone-regulated protein prm10 n=1 Tax=Coemansia guatemalensis TaxID=2761395 RepID=A0A9W8LU17_9FUNG|nr:pheromone-regulated protein prm10 [Coemansia guatemalensis]
MDPRSPDIPASEGHRSHAQRRIWPYDSANSTPHLQCSRGVNHHHISDHTQYHLLPDGHSRQHRRPASAHLAHSPGTRQRQQHQPLSGLPPVPEDSDGDKPADHEFESPPLDPTAVATVVSSPTSAPPEEVDEDGLYMTISDVLKQRNHASAASRPSGNGTQDSNGVIGERRKIYHSAPTSAAESPLSTPRNSPPLDPKSLPDTSGSVTPRMLEEKSADSDVQDQPARSNFDANYLATLGKDNDSIAIHVDNRKRARNLLRRLEGRSSTSGDGGILGNLIRLHGVVSGNNAKQVDGSSKRQMRKRHAYRELLSPRVSNEKSSLPELIHNFRHPKRTYPKDSHRKIQPDSNAAPTLTSRSSEIHLPASNARHHIRRPSSMADVRAARMGQAPGMQSAGSNKPPKSVSSARLSAMMMTSEAFVKNGIIPPPSTQSSLRMNGSRPSGYFELASAGSSPASSPLLHPTMSPTYDERAELIDRIAQILEKQDFLMHLARAWHAFGSPVHRMESSLMEVARYLDIEACFFTVPGLTLISFGDPDTHSSETHIVRASNGYDMYRLEQANRIAWRLRKGEASVHDSIRDIESLLAAPPIFSWYLRILVCFVQSFFVSTTLFHGSWKEAAISGAMGMMVGVFEILSSNYLTIGYLLNVIPPIIVALVAALLSDHICFSAVPMAATINLLPGMGLALAMLELSSSNFICGAVRLVSATMTSFMIGWGTIVGYNLGMAMLGKEGQNAGSLSNAECEGLSMLWWILFVPLSTIGFGVWFKVHWSKWPAIVFAAASGLVIQTFCDRVAVMTPISSGIASFAIGMFSNVYGHLTHSASNASIVFVGIIQLVPGSTGVRSFISFLSSDSSASSLTMSMLSTAISIAVGLLLSNGALYSEIKRFRLGSF